MDASSWKVKSLGKHENVNFLTLSQCGKFVASTGNGFLKIFSTEKEKLLWEEKVSELDSFST